MMATTLIGTLECWRGEEPVSVYVALRLHKVPPEEGRGWEADVLQSTVNGQPFELTDAEVDRAVERFTMEEHHAD